MFHLVLCKKKKKGQGCFLQGKLRQKGREVSACFIHNAHLCNQKQQVSYNCTEPGPTVPNPGNPMCLGSGLGPLSLWASVLRLAL